MPAERRPQRLVDDASVACLTSAHADLGQSLNEAAAPPAPAPRRPRRVSLCGVGSAVLILQLLAASVDAGKFEFMQRSNRLVARVRGSSVRVLHAAGSTFNPARAPHPAFNAPPARDIPSRVWFLETKEANPHQTSRSPSSGGTMLCEGSGTKRKAARLMACSKVRHS